MRWPTIAVGLAAFLALAVLALASGPLSRLPWETQEKILGLNRSLTPSDSEYQFSMRLPKDAKEKQKAWRTLVELLESKNEVIRSEALSMAMTLAASPLGTDMEEHALLLEKILERRKDKSMGIRNLVRAYLWQSKVDSMSEQDRLTYFRKAFSREDGGEQCDLAHVIKRLGEMGTREAADVLKIAKEHGGYDQEVQRALTKVQFAQAEDKFAAAKKILESNEVGASGSTKGWVIDKLGRTWGLDEKATIEFLKRAFEDKRLDNDARLQAGQALKRRGIAVDLVPLMPR